MTCLEFIEINDPAVIKEILRPIINRFVRQGYSNVPDWQELAETIREQIRKNGWGKEPVEDVALDAGVKLGMKK